MTNLVVVVFTNKDARRCQSVKVLDLSTAASDDLNHDGRT